MLNGETADSHLEVDGNKVLIRQEGNTLVGYVEGTCSPGHETKAFVFTLNENGSFSFELLTKLDHPFGHGTNDLDRVLDLSRFIKAEDFDHDGVVLAPGMVTFQVTDDVPTTTCETVVGNVDESALPDGNPEACMG